MINIRRMKPAQPEPQKPSRTREGFIFDHAAGGVETETDHPAKGQKNHYSMPRRSASTTFIPP